MQTNPNINAERIKGHLELSAGTTASAPLRLNSGVDKTSPSIGDITFDGTRMKMYNGTLNSFAFLSDVSGGGGTTTSNINDTGVLTFAGLSISSTSSISIGAATGWIVDNETNPATQSKIYVQYSGTTSIPVSTRFTGQSSYVLLSSTASIYFQNTLPTSAQRKSSIWLGKVAHPTAGILTVAANEPDFITSPLAQHRDLFQAMGPYINNNVSCFATGSNLNVNITSGNIIGDGINFTTSRTNPDTIVVSASSSISFLPRTQTGAGGSASTIVDVGNYDVNGVITAIPGSGNRSSVKYIFYIPNLGFIIQYGQNFYQNLTDGIAAIGREAFTIFPNLTGNAILIAALVATKNCTSLSDLNTARFFTADRFGQIGGSTSGVSVTNLQLAYNNSVSPEIITSTAGGDISFRRGTALDSDIVFSIQNGSGTNTFEVRGDGIIATGSYKAIAIADPYIQSATTWNNKLSSVVGTANRITVSGGTAIDIASNYSGQTTITTIGTVSNGRWQGATISTTYTEAKIMGTISNSQIAVCNGSGSTIYGTDAFKYESSLNQMTMLGGIRLGITKLSAVINYNATEGDYTIIMTNNGTVFLPVLNSTFVGKIYNIKNLGSGPDMVEVKPSGGELIDGSGVPYFLSVGQGVIMQSDGSEWYIIGNI